MREKKSNPHLIYPTIETVDVSHLEQSMFMFSIQRKGWKKNPNNIMTLISNIFPRSNKKKRYRTRSHFDKILRFLHKN